MSIDKAVLRELSNKVVACAEPINLSKILAKGWTEQVRNEFFKNGCKELPKVTYQLSDIGFDVRAKVAEFDIINEEIKRKLDTTDPLVRLLMDTIYSYVYALLLLLARGTKDFHYISEELYGSPSDKINERTLLNAAMELYKINPISNVPVQNFSAEYCTIDLQARLDNYFEKGTIKVSVDDQMISDAEATADTVKLRSSAVFSKQDIDVFEVHEGWIHAGTGQNAKLQTTATWLNLDAPRTIVTQEGLASLTELLTLPGYPPRVRKIVDRVIGIDLVENGADFVDLFNWYQSDGYDPVSCYDQTERVFRGATVRGGSPYTKDIAYLKGMLLNFDALKNWLLTDKKDLVDLLFVGKINVDDVHVLKHYINDGIIVLPKYVPEVYKDKRALNVMLSYINLLSVWS